MGTLYISRGLPGSGKSTKIRELVGSSTFVVEADDYFMVSDTSYVFDHTKLPQAHAWCQGVVEGMLRAGAKKIGVANTNIKLRDMAPYVGLARAYGYEVVIVVPDTPWAWDVDECFNRNIHGVPKDVIERMKNNFE